MPDGARKVQGWFAELRRRKVLRVAAVDRVGGWLAIRVAAAVFEPIRLPAWAFDGTPRGIERTPSGPGATEDASNRFAAAPAAAALER
jgi:hypothetical protein